MVSCRPPVLWQEPTLRILAVLPLMWITASACHPAEVIAAELRPKRVAGAVADGDWPAYGRDGGLTGFSPLVGSLAKPPQRLWTVDLGGRMTSGETVRLADVDGDGQDELLRVLPDRILCQSVQGKRLWETTVLPRPRVTQIRDFAGDGTRGLLVDVNTGVEHRRYMVSGVTGHASLLYSSRNVFGRYERFGKILETVVGEQLCAWWSGDPIARFGGSSARCEGYLWSFENGLEKPRLRFQAKEAGTIYAPLHLFADMNRDGRRDMVMISHEKVWVYDLATGRKIMQSHWGPRIRTYWAATAAEPLKKGEPPSLLMINPMIPGVQVVTQDGTKTLRKWKQVVGGVEDQYQNTVKITRGAPDPFVDLDGDGKLEILAAVTNEHGDERTHLVIFAADDGQRLYDMPDQSVLTVDQLDDKPPIEVLLREGKNTLRICHWNGRRFVDCWRDEDVEPLIRPAPPEGHLARAVGARNTGRNMPLWREAEGSKRFLMRFSDGVSSCRLANSSITRIRKIAKHAALGNAGVSSDKGYSWDGNTLSVEKDGRRTVTFRMPRRRSYLSEPPLVGHLGQLGHGRRVVVRDFQGNFIRLEHDGTGRHVLVKSTQTARGGCLADLNGDGQNELLIPVMIENSSPVVVSVDASGRRRLQITSPPGTTEASLGPTGRLGEGKGRWFVVRYRVRSANTRVVAYDGRTGKAIWTRDYLGPNRTPATSFVLHLPTAVHDMDGDGADDLIASSENWYEVISVKDNRTLAPNRTITAAVPGHWGAYATPIVFDPLGNGTPCVFHNNAYALTLLTRLDGAPIWHYGLTRDSTHASKSGLADLDGDKRIEMVTSQKDGLLRAFSSSRGHDKCPHCPASQKLTDANHGGHVRWTFRLRPPLSDFATLDVDGDGRTELLCGSGDGKLYALEETCNSCRILWSVDLGARVLSPVIADLDDDGNPEILVATSDGRLHCLGRRKNGPVSLRLGK